MTFSQTLVSVKRRPSGQALSEGVAGLVVVTMFIAGAVAVLISTGMLMYYKTKLAVVAELGARYGTRTRDWLGAGRPGESFAKLSQEVKAVVRNAMRELGLPPASDIRVVESRVNHKRYIKVSVSVGGLRMFSAGFLPNALAITESACSAFGNTYPPAVFGWTLRSGNQLTDGQGIYIPSYGAGANTPGPGTFPQGRFAYYGGYIAPPQGGFDRGGAPYQNQQTFWQPFSSYWY